MVEFACLNFLDAVLRNIQKKEEERMEYEVKYRSLKSEQTKAFIVVLVFVMEHEIGFMYLPYHTVARFCLRWHLRLMLRH